MIRISKENYQKIVTHALAELPNEACGLIAGRTEGTDRYIEKVYLLTNIDHSSEHFSMNPKEQLDAIQDIRKAGYVFLGNWHSHPETPSRPSEEDKRLAYDKNISYLILSLMEPKQPILHSFRLINGGESKQMEQEELKIEDFHYDEK